MAKKSGIWKKHPVWTQWTNRDIFGRVTQIWRPENGFTFLKTDTQEQFSFHHGFLFEWTRSSFVHSGRSLLSHALALCSSSLHTCHWRWRISPFVRETPKPLNYSKTPAKHDSVTFSFPVVVPTTISKWVNRLGYNLYESHFNFWAGDQTVIEVLKPCNIAW